MQDEATKVAPIPTELLRSLLNNSLRFFGSGVAAVESWCKRLLTRILRFFVSSVLRSLRGLVAVAARLSLSRLCFKQRQIDENTRTPGRISPNPGLASGVWCVEIYIG